MLLGMQYADFQCPSNKLEQKEGDCRFYILPLNQLPENQKRVLLMHKFEGLSQKEISDKLNSYPNFS